MMKELLPYRVDPTKRTPKINLEEGRICIAGRSIPVNPGEFYRPVYDWICDYIHGEIQDTSIEFGFEYINTSSTKWVYNIIKEIASMKELAGNIRIYWYYDKGDEDMCELGLILRSLVDCQFFVIEVEGNFRNSENSITIGSYCQGQAG
jgi:hypothetical protein